MPERLVVIGADAAGMSAASQARRMRGAHDLEIVAFERSTWVSYSACGTPYFVGGYVPRVEDLIARTPAEFAEREIDVRIRHEVTAIDTAARRVTVRDLERGRDLTL
ncbi:MAG: FAD-dependent oxidoreductase, partial [Chloroflexi bacterium]|nr:FAD-dependent oxidoreductase [Chloroflexota bacterium]